MAEDSTLQVPSGQPVTLHEVLAGGTENAGTWYFRFVAPDLGQGRVDYEEIEPDLETLCRTVAIPQLTVGDGPAPERIVISLSERATVFGDPAPGVVQVFEAYLIENNDCQWEPF